MPPYPNGQKPTRTAHAGKGLVVSVPLCLWCTERIGYPCKICGLLTCYPCLRYTDNDENKCVHSAYREIQATGWELPA